MSFVVEVERRIKIVQGLPSPVRARSGLPPIPPGEGVVLVIKVGVAFEDDQLTDRGWFVDTDAVAEDLDKQCATLTERPWTESFPFRPTFELVARHLYGQWSERIPQLSFVELRDDRLGVTTRYTPG